MKSVCVIGGGRYFGLHLIELLRDAGTAVTVVNRGTAAPPAGVAHVVADRDDEEGLRAALGRRTFDVVVDQVCYTPLQAALARRVFAGRTSRYVMTSTMEVYDPATSALVTPAAPGTPVTEDSLDPATWPVDGGPAGHDASRLPAGAVPYAEDKRRAEAVLARESSFAFVAVRSAHVLGVRARDFTGRLGHYVERILAGRPIAVHRDPFPTSFTNDEEIAGLLFRVAASDHVGAVNACSHGPLDVIGLCEAIGERAGRRPVYRVVEPGEAASPFSFDRHYAMDNGLAVRLGLPLSATADWLPDAVAATLVHLKAA
ncbi:reductase [Nonomuraea sp. SMC257]|uniref:Reductase n=1 Tax=Nonomuraea montanisoli TaxID=2741721 RepID=A0A7Y6M116_9ACTN|nr:reductase [Nonomuraea montanisoli]NUW30602.1 reductase [Nonomuraea montanisoli]